MKSTQKQPKNHMEYTPINAINKSIQKTTVPKATFFKSSRIDKIQQEQQNDHEKSFDFSISKNRTNLQEIKMKTEQSIKDLKESKFLKGSNQKDDSENTQKLNEKISFLQHCLNQYKQQVLSLYSKLTQRQQIFSISQDKYVFQIDTLRRTIKQLQTQLIGQNRLIQQFSDKFDKQTIEKQLCLKQITEQKFYIQDLKTEIHSLQKINNNTREVSVGLIKENQALKAEVELQKEKYQLLLRDYDGMELKFREQLRTMERENSQLKMKLDRLEMEVKIYQKDKEIQQLLAYEDTIDKRQRETISNKKSNDFQLNSERQKTSRTYSPYDYLPRRLNFDEQTTRTNKKSHQKSQQQLNQYIETIQLQKDRITHLQTQNKQLQKRNKQLQNLMVKYMK